MARQERDILERAIRALSEQAAAASALVDEAIVIVFPLGFVLGGLVGCVVMATVLAARVESDKEHAYWDGYRHGAAAT